MKPQAVIDSTTTSATRRHPRYAVGGRITCDLLPAHLRAALINVSRGGCLIRSPLRYRVGDVQRFQFTLEAERDAIYVLRARIVHCAAGPTDGGTWYLVGLEFLDSSTPVCNRAIDHLVMVAAS